MGIMKESNQRLQNRTASSNSVQLLRGGPKTAKEIGSIGGAQIKNIVCRLKKPPRGGSSGAGKTRPTKQTNSSVVYYLWGDERQAVRRFMEEWPEYVESCMNDSKNPLQSYWDEVMWELLKEEWHIDQQSEENN